MESESPSFTDPITWISYALLGLIIGMAQAGGIGGGPIVSPIMMALMEQSSKKAIWNTYVMLFGGSIGNFIRLSRERSTSGNTPLINYQLVMITLPLLLSGAILGVATGKWLPKLFVVVLLFIVLLSVFRKTRSVYLKSREREKQEQLVEMKELQIQQDLNQSQELTEILSKDAILYPKDILQEMAISVSIVLVATLLKGSPSIPSLLGVDFCGYAYHVLNFCIFGIAYYNVQRYKKIITEDESHREQVGYQFPDGRMSTVFSQTVKASMLAGFLGGLVGLGGGVILTPLWLDTGINPRRAAASATFSVFFTSSISVFTIVLSGGYTLEEFFSFSIIAGIGSYMVAGFLKQLVLKYKRESIIIQVLLGVMAFGLIVLPIQSIKDISHNAAKALEFSRLC